MALAPLVHKLTKNYIDRRIKKKDIAPLLSNDEAIQEANAAIVMEEQLTEDNSDNSMGISGKLVSLCLVPMLIITIVVTSVSVNTLTDVMESEVEKSLKLVATSVSETYTQMYEGDYEKSQSGKVSKGGVNISGDNDLIDAIKAETEFNVSMLFGNMRLLTTLTRENGARVNGTSIDAEIYAQIESGTPVFLSNQIIMDENCYVFYQPLVNSDGSVAGAIEVITPSSEVKSKIESQTRVIMIISIILLIIAIALILIMSNHMSNTMKEIKRFLGELKDGKLDCEPDVKQLERKDELGDIYESSVQLQSTLSSIVNSIKEASIKISKTAGHFTGIADDTRDVVENVSTSTMDISMKARQQAEDANSVSENVGHMNTDIKEISRDMDTLVGYADSMAQAENKSQQILGELNEQSIRTKEALDAVSAQVRQMNESVQNIKKAVKFISDIAEETDLLSLNASIEAAKAGEAGRGFSVVAEQIGKLALQSNNSAEEINVVIKSVMDNAEKTSEIMEEVNRFMELQQAKLEETKSQSVSVSEGVSNSLEGIDRVRSKISSLNSSSTFIKGSVVTLAGTSVETDSSATATSGHVQGMLESVLTLKESADQLNELASQLDITLNVFSL